MENTNYDYLKNLSEEDQIALLEIKRRREEANEERYDEIMEDISDRKKRQGLVALACGLSAIIAVCGFALAKTIIDEGKEPDPVSVVGELVMPNIEVDRYYTVEFGDSLYYLSKISGMSIEDIKNKNNLHSDIIKLNQKLVLEYKILPTDIPFCTETVEVNGRSAQEIAGLYNTNVKSLIKLNKDAIEEITTGDKIDYIILSNEILVPNYRTPSELVDAKNNKVIIK